MVLVGLESLQIRALHSQSAQSVSLRGAVLEGAESLPAGRHANNVEICMCPANYLGDSCQVRGRWVRRLGGSHRAADGDAEACKCVCRNVLQATTETRSACSWGSASPAAVTDTRTGVWTGLGSVW